MTDATSTKKLTLSGEIDQDGFGGWIEDNVSDASCRSPLRVPSTSA
jgi:hypothetical protein